jgi:hypothetical protein
MLKVVTITIVATFAASYAIAGERTGRGEPTAADGASLCMTSGLTDEDPIDPGSGPAQPHNYGQGVRYGFADPVEDKEWHPGNLCDPNNLPMKEIGHSRPRDR